MTVNAIQDGDDLIRSAALTEISVFIAETAQLADEPRARVIGKLGSDDDECVAWAAHPFLFALSALAFESAEARDDSDAMFRADDRWSVSDMLSHLRFLHGELHFRADHVRGRMVKTRIVVRGNGSFELETAHRGDEALRWLSLLRGDALDVPPHTMN